jgi:hypothetical protein
VKKNIQSTYLKFIILAVFFLGLQGFSACEATSSDESNTTGTDSTIENVTDGNVLGTDVGNPPTSLEYRTFSGSVELDSFFESGHYTSDCDVSAPLEIGFGDGVGYTSAKITDGKYAVHLDKKETYSDIAIMQDGQKCVSVVNGFGQGFGGFPTYIPAGDFDLDLSLSGDSSLFNVTTNESVLANFDQDKDGIVDSVDHDANGDGVPDRDADFDGKAQFIQGKIQYVTLEKGIFYMHPYNKGKMILKEGKFGEVIFYFKEEPTAEMLGSFEEEALHFYDSNGDPVEISVKKVLSKEHGKIEGIYVVHVYVAGLTFVDSSGEVAEYTLIVDEDIFTSSEGNVLERQIMIDFTALLRPEGMESLDEETKNKRTGQTE